jgi:hypothetical protein
MRSVLLFFFYFTLLSLILTRLLNRSRAGISSIVGILLFAFKVALGCAYGYIFLKYYAGDDPWKFYQDSLPQYQQLIDHPAAFFSDLLPGSYFEKAENFSQGWSSYLKELEYLLMVKFLAICDLISRKNYYIDILFFDFVVFLGPLLLFKLLTASFPGKRGTLLFCLFLIPSITFWTSGIRAEGLLLLFLSLILYYANQWLKERHFVSLLWILIGFTGALIFRGQFLLAFLPALMGWLLSYKKPQRSGYYFAGVYLVCLLLFCGSLLISTEKNLATPLIQRQKEFLELRGNTRLPLDTLHPSIASFIHSFPQAFANSFVRPFLWEARGLLQFATALEIIGVLALFLLVLIFPEKDSRSIWLNPLVLLLLSFGLSQILLIGYVVPFPGAIVRYKAIPELFLVICLSLVVNWKQIFKLK